MRANRWVLSTKGLGSAVLKEGFAPLPTRIGARNRQTSRRREMRCFFIAMNVVG